MRWYALVSLVSDSRVQFLLWFVIVAFILAGVLTLIEFRLKREKERMTVQTINESAIEKVRQFLKNDKTPREKLDFIDKSAKEYFKETYGTSLSSSYSVLAEEFKKLRRGNEIAFCRVMFATYYSNKRLTEDEVIALGNLLIGIEKSKDDIDTAFQVSSPVGQINKFFETKIQTALKKKMERDRKMFRKTERNKELDIIDRQNEKKLLVIKKKKVQKLKFAKAMVAKINKKRREEKIKIYKENARRFMRETVSKLGALFRVGKVWKNKIFNEANIIKESIDKTSNQRYTEIIKKGMDEDIKGKFFDSIRVHKGKESVSLKKNNFFSYSYNGRKNLRNVGQKSLQKQAINSDEFNNGVNIIKEGIAERIIRKEKERLRDRGIFAVEI